MPNAFFESKVRFAMANPLRGDIFLSGQAYDAGTIGALKPWQLSRKTVLRARALHETDLSSKLRSRCGAAPIFGFACCRRIPRPSAAFCETAVRFSWQAQYVLR